MIKIITFKSNKKKNLITYKYIKLLLYMGERMSHVLRIRYFNQHWDGRRHLEGRRIYIRRIFYRVLDSILKSRFVILTGPVGMGKTTLIHWLIDKLVEKGVNPKNILYVSMEDDVCDVEEALRYYETEIRMRKIDGDTENIYIFIDEVSFDPDWVNTVKRYIDEENIRFIISSSIYPYEASELNATVIQIKPLTFKEYLEFHGYKVDEISFEKLEIRRKYIEYLDYSVYFKAYLRTGGYPGLLDIRDERYIMGWIKNNVIDRITYKIIPNLKGKRESVIAEKLLRIIAFDAGKPINYNNIAQLMNKDIRTVSNYLEALQTAYVVRVLKNLIGVDKGSRKLPKIHLYTPGYAYPLYPEKFEDDEYIGRLVEGLLATFLDAKYYWKRGGKEVGLIWDKDGETIPLIIRYVKRLTRREIKKAYTVLRKLDGKIGLIIVKDSLEFTDFNDGREIWGIPAWLFTLMIDSMV